MQNNTAEWLEDRKKYITGTDIAQIMNFLIHGNELYYNKSIYNFSADKANPPKPDAFTQKMFNDGHLCEQAFRVKLSNTFPTHEILAHKQYTNDIVKVTQDFEVLRPEKGTSVIFEVKTVRSSSAYKSYVDRTHMAHYQACAQLYCNSGAEKVVLYVQPVALLEQNDKYTAVKNVITREDKEYKDFIEQLPVIKEIHNAYMAGREYFVKNANLIVPDNITSMICEIKELSREIAEKDARKKYLEDQVLSFAKDKTVDKFTVKHPDYSDREYTVNRITRTSTVIKAEHKAKHKEILEKTKNIALKEFHDNVPDCYEQKTVVYISVT